MLSPRRLPARRLVVAVAAALAATITLGAAPALAATPAHHPVRVSPHVQNRHRRHADSKQQSLNWSGYVRAGSTASPFTSVSGSWTVPTVDPAQDGYSSTWVGIDGATAGDQYLIQTGTEADVVNGRAGYQAWWEVITPADEAPETVFTGLTVHPGDSISASVSQTASGRWTMRLRDNTTRHSASHTVAFAGPGTSAEWIQEDTDVDGSISPAPNWGSVTFRRLLLNHANPRLQPGEAVDIVDSHGTREDSTSTPTSAGSGFTVTWLAAGTPTRAG